MASPLEALRSRDHEDDEEVQEAMEREDLPWGKGFKFIGKMLWRHPFLLAISLLLGVGIAAAQVVSLSLLVPFIESLTGGGGSLAGETKLAWLVPYFEGFSTVEKIRLIAVALVAVQIIKGGLKYLSGRLRSYQRILLDRDLRQDIFDQIVDLEMSYINEDKVANLYTILHSYSSDTASAASALLKAIPKAASLLGYLVALLLLSWELTLFALILAAVATRTINVFVSFIRRLSKKINVLRVRLKHVSLESLNGLKVVHLFGREEHAKEQFSDELVTYQDNKYKRSTLNAAITPVYSTMITGMFAVILVAGTFLLDTGAATWVALLSMFMIVMSRLMRPTSKYAKTKAKIAKKLPSIDEIIQFLDPENKPYLEDGDVEFQGLERGLSLEGVWFRYGEDEPMVLEDISFDLPKGKTVALVGGSGAGKSTTVDLIARLYDPTRGQITVDGRDLREYEVKTWRQSLAVVSQDTFLFNQSAMDNIRYGRLDASDEEVIEAAKLANAHDFIEGLPEGYQTELGDNGVRLSGGQAQRVAIARAILTDPDVLLLDEATSSLDTETERKVQEALDRVSEDRTVLAIAHRLSTIQNADEILVMEDGEIVERGAHEELMAKGGHYWRYVQMQDIVGEDAEEQAPTAGGDGSVSTNGTGPERSDEPPMRVVVTPGSGAGVVRRNGSILGEARIVLDQDAEDPRRILERTDGDAIVLRAGSRDAVARVSGDVLEDLPLFMATQEGDEVRVGVQEIRNGRAPTPSGTDDAR